MRRHEAPNNYNKNYSKTILLFSKPEKVVIRVKLTLIATSPEERNK
jgi:hypothetical protein